jgi:hypothetical protein
METNDKNIPVHVSNEQEPNRRNSGRILGGIVVIAVGSVFLAHKLGYYIPEWVFKWQMFLIAIGVYIGAKHSFRGVKWLIPIAIGTIFLITDITFSDISNAQIFWPVIIILVGIMMIVKPGRHDRERWRKRWGKDHRNYYENVQTSSEDVLDSVTIFGSLKKNVISKEFKGGESVSVFAGTELNLMQADINGRVVLELVQVFGGTKLLVPANWQIHSEEMVSIFGGLEDKRPLPSGMTADQSKVLVLRGTCLFGGINIKSY